MNRRDMFLIGGSTAAAHVLYTGLVGCGAQSTVAGSTVAGSTTPTTLSAESLAEIANACALACENCLTASLNHAAHGMTDMLACARLARECAALCRATATLAAAESSRLGELARVCAACCDECSAQCASHREHEPACGACADACARCAEACRAA